MVGTCNKHSKCWISRKFEASYGVITRIAEGCSQPNWQILGVGKRGKDIFRWQSWVPIICIHIFYFPSIHLCIPDRGCLNTSFSWHCWGVIEWITSLYFPLISICVSQRRDVRRDCLGMTSGPHILFRFYFISLQLFFFMENG